MQRISTIVDLNVKATDVEGLDDYSVGRLR